MQVILILLGALLLAAAVLYTHHRLSQGKAEPQPEPEPQPQQQEECCGLHITCEKDSLLAAVSTDIVYYDDEDLDRFRGRPAADYTPEEAEEFRDVLLTMLPDDIAGWARSLQLRGIELPSDVREELLLIVAEERANKAVPHPN